MQYSKRLTIKMDNKYEAKFCKWYSRPTMASAQLHTFPVTVSQSNINKTIQMTLQMYDTDFLLMSSVFLLEERQVVTPTSFRIMNFNEMHCAPEKIKLTKNKKQCPTWMQYGEKMQLNHINSNLSYKSLGIKTVNKITGW